MRVLILCTGNSARSQMAEGLLRHDAGNVCEVFSAGTKPTHVRPEAIAMMREVGIDISGHRSKSVDDFAGQDFDYVITVCDNANESCPVFPAKTKRIHWSIEDPAAVQASEEEILSAFRRARDELRGWLQAFAQSEMQAAKGKLVPCAQGELKKGGWKMPEEDFKVTVDKFTFLIPKGLSYNEAGVWVKLEGNRARLGLADFTQQRDGDIAFARVSPVGTKLEPGDEFADIETVKANVSFPSPVKGTIVEINLSLEGAAELINQDPYGKGWLAVLELTDWENDRTGVLDAKAYSALVKDQAEAEMRK